MPRDDIIDEIDNLPHAREFICPKCSTPGRTHILHIYATCAKCGERVKLRGMAAIGSEVEDVMDAALEWLRADSDAVALLGDPNDDSDS